MKQILVEIDDALAAKLEKAAPARSRRRSQFVREALARALWDLEEKRTAEAYRRQPDTEHAYFEAEAWEPRFGGATRRRQRR